MSKETYEAYIVVIGRRDGVRYADRKPLNVPVDHATGSLKGLSDLQLREAAQDLAVEQERRNEEAQRHSEVAAKCGGYDPFASQIRRS